MTKITIIDTGYLSSNRGGTAKTGTDITKLGEYLVNGGNAITINCSKFHLESGINLSSEANPSSNQASKTSFNSFQNDVYTVSFILDATSATDRALLKEMLVLGKTKGVKLLYSSDTTTELKMTPELIGRTDTKFHINNGGSEIAEGIPVLVGRIKGIRWDDESSTKNLTLKGSITIEEEKVISA